MLLATVGLLLWTGIGSMTLFAARSIVSRRSNPAIANKYVIGWMISALLLCASSEVQSQQPPSSPTLGFFEFLTGFPANTLSLLPRSINSHGDTAGFYLYEPNSGPISYNGFAHIDGTLHVITGLINADAYSINDVGVVVGEQNSGERAFRFTVETGKLNIDLGNRTGLYDINESGVAVGTRRGTNNLDYLITYPGGDVAQLTVLGGQPHINNDGTIAGAVEFNSIFKVKDGGVEMLGAPIANPDFIQVTGINDNEQIVGVAQTFPGVVATYGYLYDGNFALLPPLVGDTEASASGIDQFGRIVGGSADTGFTNQRAVIWVDQHPFDLNTIVGPEPLGGATLLGASAIGENGWVTGVAELPSGDRVPWRAQLGTPRKIVLAFGHDAFVSISSITNAAGETITYSDPAGTHPAYTEESAAFEQFKEYVRDEVEAIFRSSDADTIEVVIGGIDPAASNIFFVDKDIIPPTSLLGQAYTGIDQFDANLNGEAFIMLGADDIGDPASEKLLAETVAHEAGHLLGLIHIDPPGAHSVMDYDDPGIDQGEFFVNGVFPREEPPGSGNTIAGVTHNPSYHLLRYVEGHSDVELAAAGVEPGTWDLMPTPPLDVGLNFELAVQDDEPVEAMLAGSAAAHLETILYDVLVLESPADPDEALLLGFFAEITLEELAAESFMIAGGSSLRLLASSEPGGESDVALALGDLFADGSTVLYPGFGDTAGFLQMRTGSDSFVTLASVALSLHVVPEPSTLVLTTFCLLGGLYFRRAR